MAGGELWKEMVRLPGVQGNPGPIWEQSFKDGPLVPLVHLRYFFHDLSLGFCLVDHTFSLVLVF
jgi:hypothetical protein